MWKLQDLESAVIWSEKGSSKLTKIGLHIMVATGTFVHPFRRIIDWLLNTVMT